ncbi:hypothetical protein L7F22_010325 [Adiantum nelumboides]|nr:hypothetical protein [Adiantum nelumboides]
MARSMIKAKGLPDSFWVEAINTAVYILNRSYTKAVKDMTPLQAFYGKKPSVSHFGIFGSDCYVHVPNASRTKWDAKSQKCIFLGYSEESKSYRLYNPTTKKIVISRDVVFAEQPHHEEEDEDSSFENQEIPTYQSQPPTTVSTPFEVNAKLSREDASPLVDAELHRRLVGGLIYLCNTRPDICEATGVLSRFSNKPHENHRHAGKRVLRYIAGTLDYGITYTRGGDSTLVGFCDSDWAGDIDGRRSVIGYCFSLGSGVISWISKKQPTVALSSTEAEYKATYFASCEALWLRRLLGDMGAVQEQPTMLLCDNQSCMAIARSPVFHARTKHIEVQYHFVRELILDGEVEMEYCPTMDNCADIFTKVLGSKTLERHFHQIGVGPKQ